MNLSVDKLPIQNISFLYINRNQCKRYFPDRRFPCNSKHISQTSLWYVKIMMDAGKCIGNRFTLLKSICIGLHDT